MQTHEELPRSREAFSNNHAISDTTHKPNIIGLNFELKKKIKQSQDAIYGDVVQQAGMAYNKLGQV